MKISEIININIFNVFVVKNHFLSINVGLNLNFFREKMDLELENSLKENRVFEIDRYLNGKNIIKKNF